MLETSFRGIISPNEVSKARINMHVYVGDRVDIPPRP